MVGPKNDSSSKNRHESFSSVSIIEVIKINVDKKCAPKLLFSIKKKSNILMIIDIEYHFESHIFDVLSFVVVFTKWNNFL